MHADAERDTGPAGCDLLEHLQIDLVRLATAAVLLGDRQGHQVGLAQHGEDVAGETLRLLVRGRAWRQLAIGDLAGQLDEVVRLRGRQVTVDRHVRPTAGTARAALPCGRGRSRRCRA